MIARRSGGGTLRQLRTLFNLGTIGELTDGQLLERFATDRDEAAELAFAALVERHQAMVWRACLAILRDRHQAEDAFQATFLVLVRKARSLWVRDSLAPWLHQVACRTATCLRSASHRRLGHERRRAEQGPTLLDSGGPARDPDLDAAIHEAVGRLPEKYRAPVVLCDLQGRTHAEAARALGWPIGTVKSRQSRGRKLIRDRLLHRGLGAAVAPAVVDACWGRPALAAIPAGVPRLAVALAMGQSARSLSGFVAPLPVLTLAQGVVRTMFWNRFRTVAVAALTAGIACGGAGVYVQGSQEPVPKASQPDQARPATTPPAAAAGEPPPKLLAQRLAARRAYALHKIARLNRELAEIAVEEYETITYAQDQVTAGGAIAFAEADLTRAGDRLAWSRRMNEKGYVSEATRRADELAYERARFDVEQARTQLEVLVSYTGAKMRKQLRSQVDKAVAEEQATQVAAELEDFKAIELEVRSRDEK